MDSQGKLERTRKVREKSGNSKINGYGSLKKMHLFCSKGEGCTFSLESLSPSPSLLGATLKGRIGSLGEQILSFKSSSQI